MTDRNETIRGKMRAHRIPMTPNATNLTENVSEYMYIVALR